MSNEVAADQYRRRDGQPLKLSKDERRERASAAGKASQSLSAYVKRIIKGRDKLTEADRAALQDVVMPTRADVYLAGLNAGIELALEYVGRARLERAA